MKERRYDEYGRPIKTSFLDKLFNQNNHRKRNETYSLKRDEDTTIKTLPDVTNLPPTLDEEKYLDYLDKEYFNLFFIFLIIFFSYIGIIITYVAYKHYKTFKFKMPLNSEQMNKVDNLKTIFILALVFHLIFFFIPMIALL